MRKICLVDFDMSVTGGVEQVTSELLNELCKNYEVYLYEINSNGVPAYDLDPRVKYIRGVQGQVRLRGLITGTFRRFIHLVKNRNIDTVMLMGNYPALIVSFTRFFTKAKYIYCDHGGLMNQWYQKDITAIRFWSACVAHKVVVLTEKTRRDYIEKFHLKENKVECIYNWIAEEIGEAKKSYDCSSKKILTVGRLGKEKGYDLLVEVAKKILPTHQDWQWHVYGSGEMRQMLEEKIEEYRLEDQLILKGNVDHAYRYYSDYAFLVLPSYREGLPLVLLEALELGLPMVSFDIETGPNEIIEDEKNGYLIPPYDLEQMGQRMTELMEDASRRKAFSTYEGNKDKFSKNTILKQWIRLIEGLHEK